MKPAPFDYVRPRDLEEATRALAEAGENGAALAGGQSLLPILALRMAQISKVVDIGRLSELKQISESRDCVTIGAATTHAEIEDGRVADPGCGLMRRMAARIAYRAVRNQGTIGGSVAMADPAADWPVCLMALHATAIIVGSQGARRQAVADLIQDTYSTSLQPDEIVVSFEIPRLQTRAKVGVSKVSKKTGAFAASLAVAILEDGARGARVCLAGVGGRARRLAQTSELLNEARSSEASLREAISRDLADDLPEGDDYALRLHSATVLRAVAEARSQ